jgi:hypothetical protein
MESTKTTGTNVSLDGVSEKVTQVGQIVNQAAFQKIINDIASKPAKERQSFAESVLSLEALGKQGISIPKGGGVGFRLPPDGKPSPQRKVVRIEVIIPDVGIVVMRAPVQSK